MWRNSKRGVKNIVAFCFVLLLLASPCFARASWAAFFPVNGAINTSAVPSQGSESQSLQGSSPVDSTAQSETQRTDSSMTLQEQLKALEEEFTELEAESQMLETSWMTLTEQLKAYRETKKISEEVYNTLMDLAVKAYDKTEVYEGFIVKQGETISSQDDEIAKLKKKAGFQQFMKLNALVGFDVGVPTWSAGLSYGFKFGSGLVMEVGANYQIGTLLTPIDFSDKLSLDKLTASVSIGFLF